MARLLSRWVSVESSGSSPISRYLMRGVFQSATSGSSMSIISDLARLDSFIFSTSTIRGRLVLYDDASRAKASVLALLERGTYSTELVSKEFRSARNLSRYKAI